jgi:hypothetical protein
MWASLRVHVALPPSLDALKSIPPQANDHVMYKVYYVAFAQTKTMSVTRLHCFALCAVEPTR